MTEISFAIMWGIILLYFVAGLITMGVVNDYSKYTATGPISDRRVLCSGVFWPIVLIKNLVLTIWFLLCGLWEILVDWQ